MDEFYAVLILVAFLGGIALGTFYLGVLGGVASALLGVFLVS